MTGKDLQKQISTANIDRIGQYMKVFDRILLYAIASNMMTEEQINNTISFWELLVKKSIDADVVDRTDFLESTGLGRLEKYNNAPDGENLRLSLLHDLKVAKNIVIANLHKKDDHSDDVNY